MITSEEIQKLIQKPEKLSRETLYELRNLIARFPYFQTARLLYLKNLYLLHDASFGEELRKSVLYITDRRILFYLIEGDTYKLTPQQKLIVDSLEKENPDVDRTLSLIDSFLATVPDRYDSPLNLSLDYTPYLLEAEEEKEEVTEVIQESPVFRQQELIDGFIKKAEGEEVIRINLSEEEEEEEGGDVSVTSVEDEEDESYFTETLARIYVKQKRYSKALEIIKKLSLKYPKKNAYFADQIRFLEKLIINTKSK